MINVLFCGNDKVFEVFMKESHGFAAFGVSEDHVSPGLVLQSGDPLQQFFLTVARDAGDP